jgi:D-alanine-D-alanine ligase
MPFTGSDSLSSAIAMNKILTKKAVARDGVKSPNWKEILSIEVDKDPGVAADALFKSFILPAVIKPASNGSSVGISIARNRADLFTGLIGAAKHGHSILVEEFIPGIEATCGVIEGFRGEELYALPPIEIRSRNAFFDYEAKYAGGKAEEIVPATFSEKLKREIEELSRKIHRALGLRHYSRSDFIIHPRRGVYFLEVNTLPGLTEESLMPKALKAVGSSLPEFVGHVIELAMEDR